MGSRGKSNQVQINEGKSQPSSSRSTGRDDLQLYNQWFDDSGMFPFRNPSFYEFGAPRHSLFPRTAERAMAAWDPFGPINTGRFMNQIERQFPPMDVGIPRLDVHEDGKNLVVHADLAGMSKDDVKVDVKDGVLHLSGEKQRSKDVKNENYIMQERAFGRFHRSFALPESAREDDISATYKDGVLEVVIPKEDAAKDKVRSIKIE